MREYTGPGAVEVSDREVLTDALWEAARTAPERPVLSHREGDRFVEWSTERFVAEVRRVAKGLIGLGVEHGQRVAIFSSTRVEWTILDHAIWAVGGVTVPIYETSSSEQVEWIVSDAEVTVLVAEDAERRREYDEVADRLPGCEHVFVLEEEGLDHLAGAGGAVTDEDLDRRTDAVTGSDVATIVYTSGTTGRPKGCVLTHHSFVWTVAQVDAALGDLLDEGRTTLLFLPLAHIFSRVIQVVVIRSGMVLGFSTGPDQLQEELAMFRPTFLLAVPRLFEKVVDGARTQARDEGRGPIFDHAARIAARYSREEARGRPSRSTRLQHRVFDRLVYRKLREAMGGEVECAVSGGAPLGAELGHFFAGIGVPVLEGYGLTETTAPAAVNRPDGFKVGTVGPPLPGVAIRIGDEGQIQVKAPSVFAGYLGNQEATDEVLDADGWFDTEDLGEFDRHGFLRVTGRQKDVIVTAGGKNVAPGVLEDRLRSHPLVSQSLAVGDGRPFVGALLSLDHEELERWAEERDKPSSSVEDLAEDDELLEELQSAVDHANQAVSRPERVREFRVVPDEFSVDEGHLTPTMKVKRDVVADRYQALIDDIYAGS